MNLFTRNVCHVTWKWLVTVEIFTWKWGTESFLIFIFLLPCSMTLSIGFITPPFNRVYVLIKTVSFWKQVTWHAKRQNNLKYKTYTTLKGGDTLAWYYWAFSRHKFSKFRSANVPHFKQHVLWRHQPRNATWYLQRLSFVQKVKQLLTETGMVGKSYFNHRKRKVSKISAGGRLRKNNQALSYLRGKYWYWIWRHTGTKMYIWMGSKGNWPTQG